MNTLYFFWSIYRTSSLGDADRGSILGRVTLKRGNSCWSLEVQRLVNLYQPDGSVSRLNKEVLDKRAVETRTPSMRHITGTGFL